ncbi:MAG: hypothetical protein JST26_11440 [Bacteroidetes bacterium]|nr:hypothetical protein [Bacteroidota bacterium]
MAQVLESYSHRIARVYFLDNGIVNIHLDNDAEVQVSDSQWQYDLLKSKFNGTDKFRILVEPGTDTSITKEAREYSTLPGSNAMTRAIAVVISSLAHRLIINFIINLIHGQEVKMRMFDSKEKAMEWLLNFDPAGKEIKKEAQSATTI